MRSSTALAPRAVTEMKGWAARATSPSATRTSKLMAPLGRARGTGGCVLPVTLVDVEDEAEVRPPEPVSPLRGESRHEPLAGSQYTAEEQREADADAREADADAREATADAREADADAREATADAREADADAREATADARETDADAREDRLAAWERHLDEQRRAHREAVPARRQRAHEAIERSRRLLDGSRSRLDRSEAALHRADARDEREQGAVDRASAAAQLQQGRARTLPLLESRVQRLWTQFAAAAGQLADAQDALAGEYEQLARQEPGQSADLLRRAEQSRRAARNIRASAESGDAQDRS